MNKNNFSDTLVEEYELFANVFPFHAELQSAIGDSLVRAFGQASKGKGRVFLDIGAGYGYTSRIVAQSFPLAKLILNDFDRDLLDRSDKLLEGRDYEKRPGDVELVIAAVADASLDAVYTSWVIHNFPCEKRGRVFQEIARVLKPGGVFVYLEKIGNRGLKREKDLAQAVVDLSGFATEHGRPDLFIEWVKHDLRDEEPELVFTDTENDALLNKNGFDGTCVKHIGLEKIFLAVKR